MATNGRWKLNGSDLVGATARVYATSMSSSRRVRQSLEPILGGSEFRQKTGVDLPRLTVEFVFSSPLNDSDKYKEMGETQAVLEDDEVWTLEAPSEHGLKVWRNFSRVALSTESWDQDFERGIARATLRVPAIVNGAWVSDGGDYCETVSGWFTKQSDNTWLREDGVNTGATPLVRLPQQWPGYPTAVKPDFSEGSPTLSATIYDNGVFYGDYDATGFLSPAPSAAGDVGVYEFCQVPSPTFLSGGVASTVAITGGIGSSMVGGHMVGA